jgi:hypothetical protein
MAFSFVVRACAGAFRAPLLWRKRRPSGGTGKETSGGELRRRGVVGLFGVGASKVETVVGTFDSAHRTSQARAARLKFQAAFWRFNELISLENRGRKKVGVGALRDRNRHGSCSSAAIRRFVFVAGRGSRGDA